MSLLDVVQKLETLRPLDQRNVERVLGVGLTGDPDNENRFVQVLRSFRVPAGIEAVELRLPLRGATRKDGLLVIDLDPSSEERIAPGDVRQRFEGAPSVEEPSPGQPPTAPEYLIYPRPWGALRFGFARPSADRLTTVVVDVER